MTSTETTLAALIALSVVTLVGSALALPWLVVRWPADHFLHDPPRLRWQAGPALAAHLARNAVGAVLVAAGVAMLVLPGQGVLTILAGLALLDVPGKRRAELALVRRTTVRAAIDALRARWGAPPLRLPGDDDAPDGLTPR